MKRIECIRRLNGILDTITGRSAEYEKIKPLIIKEVDRIIRPLVPRKNLNGASFEARYNMSSWSCSLAALIDDEEVPDYKIASPAKLGNAYADMSRFLTKLSNDTVTFYYVFVSIYPDRTEVDEISR